MQPFLTMRWQQPQRDAGIFVAEGEKVVRRLLESELEVVSLLLPPGWLETYRPLLDRRAAQEIHAFVAPKEALEQLTGFSMYQGVLAVGRIPPAWTLREAIERSAPPRLFAAVDSLTSAENLGGLVRNCVAFGVQALLVGETCSSPWLRRAVSVSRICPRRSRCWRAPPARDRAGHSCGDLGARCRVGCPREVRRGRVPGRTPCRRARQVVVAVAIAARESSPPGGRYR